MWRHELRNKGTVFMTLTHIILKVIKSKNPILYRRVLMALSIRNRTLLISLSCFAIFIFLSSFAKINQSDFFLKEDPNSKCYQQIQESKEFMVSEEVNFSCESLKTLGCQKRFER